MIILSSFLQWIFNFLLNQKFNFLRNFVSRTLRIKMIFSELNELICFGIIFGMGLKTGMGIGVENA